MLNIQSVGGQSAGLRKLFLPDSDNEVSRSLYRASYGKTVTARSLLLVVLLILAHEGMHCTHDGPSGQQIYTAVAQLTSA